MVISVRSDRVVEAAWQHYTDLASSVRGAEELSIDLRNDISQRGSLNFQYQCAVESSNCLMVCQQAALNLNKVGGATLRRVSSNPGHECHVPNPDKLEHSWLDLNHRALIDTHPIEASSRK